MTRHSAALAVVWVAIFAVVALAALYGGAR